MEKITKLTPRQEELLEEYYQNWLAVGVCTDPADRPVAESAVRSLLRAAGHDPDVPLIWCAGPLTAETLINLAADRTFCDRATAIVTGTAVVEPIKLGGAGQTESSGARRKNDRLDATLESLCQLLSALHNTTGISPGQRSQLRDICSEWMTKKSSKWKVEWTWFNGHLDSYWMALFAYCRNVLDVKYDNNDVALFDLHQQLARSCGNVYFFERAALLCDRPNVLKFNSENQLHCDGGPAAEYRDGSQIYSLNDVSVPKYLAVTPTGQLEIEFFTKLKNADVKAEFVRKYGIDRMQKEFGRTIDTVDATDDIWWIRSEYELIDMSAAFTTIPYAPYLKMRNQTTGTYHMESVPETCQTIEDALKFRYNNRSGYKTRRIV